MHERGSLVLGPGTVMPRLRAVQVVALRVAALLLARQAGAEGTRGRVPPAGRAVALAAGPVLLVLAPVGLVLLLSGLA